MAWMGRVPSTVALDTSRIGIVTLQAVCDSISPTCKSILWPRLQQLHQSQSATDALGTWAYGIAVRESGKRHFLVVAVMRSVSHRDLLLYLHWLLDDVVL